MLPCTCPPTPRCSLCGHCVENTPRGCRPGFDVWSFVRPSFRSHDSTWMTMRMCAGPHWPTMTHDRRIAMISSCDVASRSTHFASVLPSDKWLVYQETNHSSARFDKHHPQWPYESLTTIPCLFIHLYSWRNWESNQTTALDGGRRCLLCCRHGKFMLPKRRFSTAEQSVAYAFLHEFSISVGPKQEHTPLKSTSKAHTQRFVQSSFGEHKVSPQMCSARNFMVTWNY